MRKFFLRMKRDRVSNTAAVAAVAAALSLVVLLPAATAAPPTNDAFALAQPIVGESGSVAGVNTEATKESGEPRHAANVGGRSVWYRWSAPVSGEFVFDTCGAGFDTLLAVYTGASLETLTQVAANDDACAGQSVVVFTATAGVVYSIAVDGFTEDGITEAGPFTLHWRLVPRPANDDFAAAQALGERLGTTDGANLGTGAEPGPIVLAS